MKVSDLSAPFYVLAYLLAVFDGIMADKGNYPSSPGRTGFRQFWKQHPWIILGGVSGVLGAVFGAL